jgi:Lactate racemase N-terminal domain
MEFPKVVLVRQNTNHTTISDIPAVVRKELQEINLASRVCKGQKIAITAGSRGVANIVVITKTIVQELKALGVEPFIVPAMGSHGEATPEGQIKVLNTLGIDEKSVGAPIISSLEVVQIGTTETGVPVWIDKNAANADGIVLINRVKPHTEFNAPIGSGLMKMMVVGLGKHKGAIIAHNHFVKQGYGNAIPVIAREVMKNSKILFGLATVENSSHQTASIKAVLPSDIESVEKNMLVEAKRLMARLPFNNLDVLVVSEMGKQICGTGMDSNVTGRVNSQTEPDFPSPRITRIAVLDLTEESHGNAIGIGLADFTTKKLVNKINYNATYINCITGVTPEKAKIPITCDNDCDAISKALLTSGTNPQESELVWIKNTLDLDVFYISVSLLEKIKGNPSIEILSEILDLPFNEHNNLPWKPIH